MGLLGDTWDDPNTMATLNLAAGLLGGRTLGQGMSEGLKGYQDAQKNALAMQMSKLQFAQAMRKGDLMNQLLAGTMSGNGTPTADTPTDSSSSMALSQGAANGSIGPTVANAQRMDQLSASQPQPQAKPGSVVDPKAMAYDLVFNDGKNVGQWMNDRTKPNIEIVNGVAVDKNHLPPDFTMPVISSDGKASQLIRDKTAPTGWRLAAPSGAMDVYSGYQTATEAAKDKFAVPQPVDLPGNKRQALTPAQQRAMGNGGVDPATGYRLPVSVADITSNVAGGGSMDSLLPAMIQAESGGKSGAVSPKGAVGKTQLMPGTASDMGVNSNDSLENVAGGAKYLGQLRKKYGDDRVALAAYNWGPGNVDLWLKSGGDWSKLPQETQNYVSNVLKNAGQGQGTAQPPVGIPLATEADKKVDAASADASVNAAKVKTNADALLANIQQARALVKQLPYGATAPASEWWNNQQWGNPDTAAAIAKWHNIMGNFTLQGIESSGLGRMDIPIVDAINAASQVDMSASPAAKLAALDQIETNLRNHVAASTNVVPELNKPGVNTNTSTQPMTGSSNAPAARTVSLSDIAATAKASGKSTAQVTADIRAKGWKIAGDK